jgi:serine/threonine-protein kinase
METRPQVVLHKPSVGFGLTTEEGRAFYQDRLRFWSLLGLLISGTFFIVGALMSPLYGELMTAWQPPVLHVATLVVSGATWLLCRRGRRSVALLNLLDGGVVWATLLAFSLQFLFVHPDMVGKLRMMLLLIATTILVGRAIFVPSTSHRTFWLGVVAVAPIIGVTVLTTPSGGEQSALEGLDVIWAVLWSGSAIGISSVASAVIYGLRQEVRQAQRLGQYTLREKLGAGGMGVVYKASHAMLRRPTAIKLLPPDKAGETSIARFEREVQLTAGLTHPNTVAIYDYGRTPDGIFYYAMEHLDGIDLAVLVGADGAQPAARVQHILLQVVGALGEAHSVGLIHRDIKPANIILCQRGGIADVAKVVDFGLVKELDAGGPGIDLTNVDSIAGTPLYLSPEAITSPQTVDARADVYALGAVSYFLLTGTPVFEGRTPVEVCSHHLHTPPEPPSKRLGRPVPADLEGVVLECLEKEPTRRPQTAQALGERLRSCQGLGRWDEEASTAWWVERGRAILQSRASTPVDESAPTLSVDMRQRGGEALPGGGLAWPWE